MDTVPSDSRRAWCEMFAIWYARHQGVEPALALRLADAAYSSFSTMRPLTALQAVLSQPTVLDTLNEAVARDGT